MAGQGEQRPPEQPWSRAEQNYLLAEIIKGAFPNPNELLIFVVQKGIQPAWDEIPLPPGRSLNSCKSAYARLQGLGMPYRQDPQTPMPMSGYQQPPKRAYDGSLLGSREIRPKPSSGGSGYSPAVTIDQPPRKKRGRPTKAEAQAKAEAQTAGGGLTPRSEGVAPSSAGSATRPAAEIESPVGAAPPDLSRPIQPPPQRVPISSMITPTAPIDSIQSSSSSGKRKRGRSTRSDPESYPFAEGSSVSKVEEYESPYPRMVFEPADSPARAEVLRRRDDPEAGSRQPDIPQQSAPARTEPRTDPDTK